jgi:hypothetical protein
MLAKLLNRSQTVKVRRPSRSVSAPEHGATRVNLLTKLPKFIKTKNTQSHPMHVEQYVTAMLVATGAASNMSAQDLADIQICAEIDLGVELTPSDIENMAQSHAQTAHRPDWYFQNLSRENAFTLLEAVKDAVSLTQMMTNVPPTFLTQLESVFETQFGATVN